MFRKLKWRFVVLIMSMLILVFVGIFGAIYGLTANSMNKQSQFTLEKIMRAPPRPVPDSRDAFGSLIVETDSQGEILLLMSYLEVDEQAVEAAVEKILGKATAGSEAGTEAAAGTVAVANQNFGRVKIGETSYDYLVSEMPAGYKMVLLDRTPVHASLNDLLMVFIWVGVGSLLVLFGVSVFFASRAVKPIQAAFEKQQQFLADASHELRTPLTVIQTQLALLGSLGDPQEVKWIEGIKTETTNMAGLVTDMLDLAKLDHVAEPVRVEASLKALLEKSLLSYEAIFFERGIELSVSFEEEVMSRMDPEGIRRVLVILLDNALKYTPSGGHVEIRLSREKHKAWLRIRNTGEGIPEDRLEAIFDRFVRLDASRTKATGGYGLGLAIARGIAEQHGGRLTASSHPGEWTEMTLVLPGV